MTLQNPTDPNTLLPCPFCGHPNSQLFSDGETKYRRCDHCGAESPSGLSEQSANKLWSTRAPSAELTRTTESVEIGSKSVVAAPQTPRTDAFYKGEKQSDDEIFARTLETELTQAQAELKELGERFDGLAKAHEAMVPHQVELRHERDNAVAELADVKPDRDRWEKLAREAAEARLAAQAEAAAMRAERDDLAKRHAEVKRQRDRIMASRDKARDMFGFVQRKLHERAAERDAANALVDKLKAALEKAEWVLAHSTESWPIKHRVALKATKAALAEVAKSLSPRTTENTKPQ